MNNLNSIKRLIKKGMLSECVTKLIAFFEEKELNLLSDFKNFYSEIIVISGKINHLNKNEQLGMYSNEFITLERSKIAKYLIDIISYCDEFFVNQSVDSNKSIKNESNVIQVKLTIDKKFDDFSEMDKKKFINTITTLLNLESSELIINKIERGSVKITFTILKEKAAQLFQHLINDNLIEERINEVELIDFSENEMIGENYIFTYGNINSGKSTLLTSLLYFIVTHPEISIIPNIKNTEGARLFYHWVNKLREGEFPDISRINNVVEIDGTLKWGNNNVPYTMLEVSGEDLWMLNENLKDINKDDKLKNYLSKSKVILVTLSVIDRLNESDIYAFEFLNLIATRNLKIPIGIILTKIDQLENFDQSNIREFVKNNFPFTYNFLKTKDLNFDIFTFSVGGVIVDEQKIVNLNSNLNNIWEFILGKIMS